MAFLSSPQPPQYRITLFYGPEPVELQPTLVTCVFNVKKRSWKGGVQMEVELAERQVTQAKQALDFEPWLHKTLASIAAEERSDYESRARDLLIQGLCSLKLDLAIEAGIQQENGRIAAEAFASELDHAIGQQADRLKSQILADLDLAVP